jgi:uncharacterized protein (TIRG00374 family)
MSRSATAERSRSGSAPLVLVAVAIIYIGVLAAVDTERSIFSRLTTLLPVLPVLAAASFLAFVLRYVRWYRLLVSLGHCVPLGSGFLAYLSGFAFTASPGKAGELFRIRYFSQMGVPHAQIISCFVFERLLDLIVILLFATLIAGRAPGFAGAAAFVLLVLGGVLFLAHSRRFCRLLQYAVRRAGLHRPAQWLRTLLRGISRTSEFLPPGRSIPAAILGFLAWSIQCLGYAATLAMLEIDLPWWLLFAIPPASMLIGAASMMPGGIGTTEAATVVLLTHSGVELDRALLAAIALRIGSIWFSVLLGFAAISWLERKQPLARG